MSEHSNESDDDSPCTPDSRNHADIFRNPDEIPDENMYRFDSAMQYVGRQYLPDSAGFKMFFQFDKNGDLSLASLSGDKLGLQIRGYEELPDFVRYCGLQRSLDGYSALRLYSGTHSKPGCGTAVPITPVLHDNTALLVTANHCVEGKSNLSCTPEVVATWGLVPQADRVQIDVVALGLPKSVAQAGRQLRKPSSPDRNLPRTWHQADVAALLAHNVHLSGRKLSKFYVPCADQLLPKKRIVIVGYTGRVNYEWAAEYLKTEDDGEVLDAGAAAVRLESLNGTALFMETLSASPGLVHKANDEVVEHTASVAPGLSGGAGVDMEDPFKLYFHHIQSQASTTRKWSYGVSVRHPVYGCMYIKHALPKLRNVPTEEFDKNPELLPAIVNYISFFKDKWEDWKVDGTVSTFLRAHGLE